MIEEDNDVSTNKVQDRSDLISEDGRIKDVTAYVTSVLKSLKQEDNFSSYINNLSKVADTTKDHFFQLMNTRQLDKLKQAIRKEESMNAAQIRRAN